MDPKNLRYAESHEWAGLDGGVVTVGITKFAVEQLNDVTHVELSKVGKQVTAKHPVGEIESVKSVNDLYAPVDGEIVAVNTALANDPSLVTNDPYGAGWMLKIKIKPGTTLNHLLTHDQYEKHIASEGH